MDEHPIIRAVERIKAGIGDFFYDAFVNLNVNDISGDYVEFGSWGGTTLKLAHEATNATGKPRHLWAFDSFEGLPEATDPRDYHPGWRPGSPAGQGGVDKFHAACEEHGIPRDAYTAVAGYYDQSLPSIGDGEPRDIALAYIDCNMYSSAVTVFEFLEPRLKHGMILAFDDYFCWSPSEVSGERSALHEFEQAHPEWSFLRYQNIARAGLSFAVERSDWHQRR